MFFQRKGSGKAKPTHERVFGSWKIIRLLAEEPPVKIYEIEKSESGVIEKAALKVVALPADEAMLQELRNTLSLVSELRDSNHIVKYKEHQIVKREKEASGEVLIRMELSTPLSDYKKTLGFAAADVVKLAIDMCRALEVCREHHIFHRDIRPENIYVSESGEYQLGGFSAAVKDGNSGRAGTFMYMAPEVYTGGRYNQTADIYSLGLTLYSLLNDDRIPFLPAAPIPFSAADREKALARRFSGEPLPAPAHADKDLTGIVLLACAYDPRARFQTPEDMRKALEALKNAEDKNTAHYQQIANKVYPGIALFARDVNLPAEFAAKYTPGLIIKERAFTDASIRFMGMTTTHRYVILSNHMLNMSMFEHGTNWGLHIANMGSRFKVLGQYTHNGKTGIFLLHLPNDEDWMMYRNVEFDMDQDLYQTAVERFIIKADAPPVPELTTREWLDRCAFPLGMDDYGNLYDPDEVTELEKKILKKASAAEKPKSVSRPKTDLLSRIQGCLLGGAAGDALGYPVEFLSEAAIAKKYGPEGIRTLEQACGSGQYAVISDDTQMTLFAANACVYLRSNPMELLGLSFPDMAWLAYREWLGTQGDVSRMDPAAPKMWIYRDRRLHALRAPGNTCLSAIRHSESGGTMKNPINNSKGCGTVMRAAPYGLIVDEDPQDPVQRFAVDMAASDAALTHGHALAWGSSAWLAGCVFEATQNYAHYPRLENCMGNVSLPKEMDPDGTLNSLIHTAIMLANRESVTDLDAIHTLGEGWVAEEALAIAVFCAVRYQDDFAAGVRAAVNHKGDSDSTGAICGNILGAWLGREAVEQAFNLGKLELRDVVETIASDLYRARLFQLPAPGKDAEWDRKYHKVNL